jgi:hypothetical protein
MTTPHAEAGMNLTASIKLLEAAMKVCRTEPGRRALQNARNRASATITPPPDTLLALAGEILAQGPAVVDALESFVARRDVLTDAEQGGAFAVLDAARDFVAGRTHPLTAAALIAEAVGS